uniref:family 78 glycoside hydrolase catalytic domain n=1 Tax=uncultured Draconibacterium sp. TaxID=1573823 RepID=UPI0032171BC8
MIKNSQLKLSWILFPVTILLFFVVFGCQEKGGNEKSDCRDLCAASWIGSGKNHLADSLLYGDIPAPVFRKEFYAKKDIKKATLYITAAGYYHSTLNGERIGRNYFDPAWTNFAKRVYYSEYDLTQDINEGANCIGVNLGNGFYNPLPMTMWGHLNLKEHLPNGQSEFIARLQIEYNDGKTEEIITDNLWKYAYGPVKRNNVYLGESYDAGSEISGWNKIDFDDSEWADAIVGNGPGGELQKAFFPPVQITDIKTPLSITSVTNDKYLVDFGVNFTGVYKIRLKGEKGDTITFRLGERVFENGELNGLTTVAGQIKTAGKGGAGAPDIAWQSDQYIFGNKTNVWYSPEFTFHTFRYLEISGLKQKPETNDVEGLFIHSNVDDHGNFTCSSELINSIQDITERTFLANLVSVQSDCPAREKFGYGGDLNSTAESFIYNFDMQAFYRKTIYDWLDAMNDSVFVDTAPYVGLQYCGLSWESAFLIAQYNLYRYYNDTALMKELYPINLKWMEKVARIHPNGLVDKGLGDHEAIIKSPVEVTGTGHYLECARIMKTFAALMGDKENEVYFEKLANKLSHIMLEKFWRNSFERATNKQTLFATLLYYNVIPEKEVPAAVDSLMHALSEAPSGHFNTGIFGTKFILEALSKVGYADKVFEIVNSTAYPGWGFMIDRGATTIWESWNESVVLGSHSNCHPMFGSVTEWFYRWLGGIRIIDDYPGFERFVIAPTLPKGLDSVNCIYKSSKGKIVSNWEVTSRGEKIFEITVPENSQALVRLPVEEYQTISFGHTKRKLSGDEQKGRFELGPGNYTITITN